MSPCCDRHNAPHWPAGRARSSASGCPTASTPGTSRRVGQGPALPYRRRRRTRSRSRDPRSGCRSGLLNTPTMMCPSRQAMVVTGAGSGSGKPKSMVESPPGLLGKPSTTLAGGRSRYLAPVPRSTRHRSARPAAVAVDDPSASSTARRSPAANPRRCLQVSASTGASVLCTLTAGVWEQGMASGRRQALELVLALEIGTSVGHARPGTSPTPVRFSNVWTQVQRLRAADLVRASPNCRPSDHRRTTVPAHLWQQFPTESVDAGLDRHATPREIPPTKLATPAGPCANGLVARPSRSHVGAGRPAMAGCVWPATRLRALSR